MDAIDRGNQLLLKPNVAKTLLVDDDALVREIIAMALREGGHTVVMAGDGRAALAALAREAFDLVISDILMPEMDGIELLRTIRKRHPQLAVLCISGGGGSRHYMKYLDMGMSLGAHMILAKPFTPAQLRAAAALALGMTAPTPPVPEE